MELLRILEECRAAGGGDCALATRGRDEGLRLPSRRRAADRPPRPEDLGRHQRRLRRSGHRRARSRRHHARRPALAHFKPADDDLIVGLGSGCQGELTVFIEPLPESQRVLIHDRLSVAAKRRSAHHDLSRRRAVAAADMDRRGEPMQLPTRSCSRSYCRSRCSSSAPRRPRSRCCASRNNWAGACASPITARSLRPTSVSPPPTQSRSRRRMSFRRASRIHRRPPRW